MTVHIDPGRASGTDWEVFFDDAFREATADERYSLPQEGFEFAHSAWPLVEWSAKPVAQKMTELAQGGIIDPENLAHTYAEMVAPLWKSVFSAVSRVLVLEFAAAQSTGLLGTDGEDRYSVFVECLQEPDFAESLLRRNPALCELTSVICRNWRDASLEFLAHLQEDWDQLKDRFGAEANDRITTIHSSLGDTHRQGRSVKMVTFSSGSRLVYKPRSLAADRHFRDFASWFNAAAGGSMLACVEVLDMASHGWCEHIDHLPVTDVAELAAYFRRLGALIAVARVLGLTDLHSENLIAQGGWPVIIDLETLFHPLAGDLRPDEQHSPAANTLRMMHDISVAATGLLPVRGALVRGQDSGIDLAGMSDTLGQQTPFAVPMWRNAGSDGMRLTEDRQTLQGNANVPVLDDRRISPEPYLEHVLDGFRTAYAILEANREVLLSPTGPIAAFGDDPIRVVIRATQTYLFLLADGSHPDLLESRCKKDDWFDEALREANASPVLKTLRPSEMDALRRNDVPYFETRVGCRDIVTCDGRQFGALLPRSGAAIARRIVGELGTNDLERQCWLIEVALTKADVPGAHSNVSSDCGAAGRRSSQGRREKALSIARHMAAAVCECAVLKDGQATWFTVQEARGGALMTQAAGIDLYSGLPGIALFLSRAGQILDDAHVQMMGKAATRELLSALRTLDPAGMPLGGFSGVGGLIFALRALADDHADLDCDAVGQELWSGVDGSRFSDAPLELVDGLAGLLLGSLHLRTGEPVRISICNAIIKRLQRAAEKGEPSGELFTGTGLAHGVDGLRYALARLARCEDGVPRLLARRALRLLNTFLQQAPGSQPACNHKAPIAWCNGLAGALVASHGDGPDDTEIIARELIAGLQSLDHGDDSLCHGTMGALQALLNAAPSLSSKCSNAVDDLANEIVTRLARDGARCGTINGVFSPGLMDGMSGIGMAALGIADPRSTPMILKLASGFDGSAIGRSQG